MIKIEHTEVFGWAAAIRGMRNPLESWDKDDLSYPMTCAECELKDDAHPFCDSQSECLNIGENNLKLMRTLSKGGSDHAKYLRMINVTMDVTAPLYWWKEFDTYKVGTVANSCSTMHKIHAKEFTLDDFSHEHLTYLVENENLTWDWKETLSYTVQALNMARELYLETKDKEYWWQMIQLLPSSYNQKRTLQLNYQVLKSMYFARKNHKLDEWHTFCAWCEGLPYFKEICIDPCVKEVTE